MDWYSRLHQSLSVFRVSEKVRIDPPIHHVAHHPMRRNPITLVKVHRAFDCRSGVPIGQKYYESYRARTLLNVQDLVLVLYIVDLITIEVRLLTTS